MAETLIPLASPILGKILPFTSLITRIEKGLKKAFQYLKSKKTLSNLVGLGVSVLGYSILTKFIPQSALFHFLYLISIGIQVGLVLSKILFQPKPRNPIGEIMNIQLLNVEEFLEPSILQLKIKKLIQQ